MTDSGGPRLPAMPPARDPADLRAVAAELRRLVGEVEAGRLTAPAAMVATLRGIAATLDALARGEPE